MTKNLDKKNNKEIVLVSHGTRVLISRDLDLNVDTVSDALNGNSNSKVATIIRNIAVVHYGGVKQSL